MQTKVLSPATDANIPGWLVAQTAADVQELDSVLSELGRKDGSRLRALPRLRRACKKLSQDVRYIREIGCLARRKVRP